MGKKATAEALPHNAVFALDIGTRSIIGMVGIEEDGRMRVIAAERAEHRSRAMRDGQIEDIGEVARVVSAVKERLEEKSGYQLERVFVAAAGRALKTETASFELEFTEAETISEEVVSRLESGAVGQAQECFLGKENGKNLFYLIGYTVSQYYLDDYPMSSILEHHGKKIRADVVATFLPGEVVESLYTSMHKAGLEVAGLTLEPIAAINVAIPEKLRLLNLVMVDIGAGTSDIAVCRDGKVVGYTMATLAGDEITESIMKRYLVDFETAEVIKMKLDGSGDILFTDILGYEQQLSCEHIRESVQDAVLTLGKEIADKILEVNGGTPSAVFLAGGGSRMSGLMEQVTHCLGVDENRASVAGRYHSLHACSDVCDIQDPEYATPLGILVSAGLNLVKDSFSVMLNGKKAKLFSNGTLYVSDILMMNGFRYQDLLGRSGKSVIVSVNGIRKIFYGTPAEPAVLRLNGKDAGVSDLVHAGDNILFIPAQNGQDAKASVADLFEKASDLSNIRVMVNGRAAEPGDSLHYGDQVETVCIGALSEEVREAESTGSPDEIKTEIKDVREERKDAAVSSLEFELNGEKIFLQEKLDGMPYYLMDLLQYSGLDFDNISAPVVLKVNGRTASFQQSLRERDRIEIYEDGK